MQGTEFSRYILTIGIGILVLGGIVAYKLLDHKDLSNPTENLISENEPRFIRFKSRQVQNWTDMEQQGWVETTYERTETNPSPLPERPVIDVGDWTSKAGQRLERPLNSRGFKLPVSPVVKGQKVPNRSMSAPPFRSPYWMGPTFSPWHSYRVPPRYPDFTFAAPENRYNLHWRARKPRRNMCFFMGFD